VHNLTEFQDALSDSHGNIVLLRVKDGEFSRIAALRTE
jgi:hypothetical protein